MNKIGIIGAMDEEVKELQKLMKNTRVESLLQWTFIKELLKIRM